MKTRAVPQARAPRRDEAGFTLVEAVVALGVFALAAVSLLSLNGGSVRAMNALEDAAYARIVADNQIVTVLIAQDPPPRGVVVEPDLVFDEVLTTAEVQPGNSGGALVEHGPGPGHLAVGHGRRERLPEGFDRVVLGHLPHEVLVEVGGRRGGRHGIVLVAAGADREDQGEDQQDDGGEGSLGPHGSFLRSRVGVAG